MLGWLVAGVLGGWRLGPGWRAWGVGWRGVVLWRGRCGCGAALACPLCLVLPLGLVCVLARVSLPAFFVCWSPLLLLRVLLLLPLPLALVSFVVRGSRLVVFLGFSLFFFLQFSDFFLSSGGVPSHPSSWTKDL